MFTEVSFDNDIFVSPCCIEHEVSYKF